MKEETEFNNIKKAITCYICQEVCTLPVHPECCNEAKCMNPGCESCVRKYYELDKISGERTYVVKSWCGCGCNVYLNDTKIYDLYSDTIQLDMIRNSLGPSVCYKCGIPFETTAELRRHLRNEATTNDKHGNCQEINIKCEHCNRYGKRKWIEGEHFIKEHAMIKCDVCEKIIKAENLVEHYDTHCKNMVKFQEKIKDLENKMELALKINS